MKIAIIGTGAISTFVQNELAKRGVKISALVVREGKESNADGETLYVSSVADLPNGIELLVDCAGHEGLRMHGVQALEAGIDVLTLSIGALADSDFETALNSAATKGQSKLHLASGAIGSLDALRASRIGALHSVTYTGRKPTKGWQGSPAEGKIDLENLTEAAVHFLGSARDAATFYPKNANVAAAVALSSLGFDETKVELIADPHVTSNIHEITALGEFGEMKFTISGNSLSSNPKSSALAAMSIVSDIMQRQQKIAF